MTERDFTEALQRAIEFTDDSHEGEMDVRSCTSYADGGVLTMNQGFTVSLQDGSEFQITIVRSAWGDDEQAERQAEEDESDD